MAQSQSKSGPEASPPPRLDLNLSVTSPDQLTQLSTVSEADIPPADARFRELVSKTYLDLLDAEEVPSGDAE